MIGRRTRAKWISHRAGEVDVSANFDGNICAHCASIRNGCAEETTGMLKPHMVCGLMKAKPQYRRAILRSPPTPSSSRFDSTPNAP